MVFLDVVKTHKVSSTSLSRFGTIEGGDDFFRVGLVGFGWIVADVVFLNYKCGCFFCLFVNCRAR